MKKTIKNKLLKKEQITSVIVHLDRPGTLWLPL